MEESHGAVRRRTFGPTGAHRALASTLARACSRRQCLPRHRRAGLRALRLRCSYASAEFYRAPTGAERGKSFAARLTITCVTPVTQIPLQKLSLLGRVISITSGGGEAMRIRVLFVLCAMALLLSAASAQDQNENQRDQNRQHDMAGNEMSSYDMPDMKDMDDGGGAHAMHTMESRHMDMGPHMKMTTLCEPKSGDQERAGQIVATARQVAEKYKDYHVALADGYKIFLPNVPQKQYHFTNNRYAFAAAFRFNPEHPTSLLYEKHGDDYKLIGVMYTARKNMSENQLD